jgi:hypothetical protein
MSLSGASGLASLHLVKPLAQACLFILNAVDAKSLRQ